MVRVLIVEDSATLRALLKHLLESDPQIQVIGVAANGQEGVQKAVALKPDLITMDIRMPVMDGFEATQRIMAQCPTPIVVVSSSVEASDLQITFNAIQAGALEVIEKPSGMRNQDYEAIRERLITTVKLMAEVKVIRRRFPAALRPLPQVDTYSVLSCLEPKAPDGQVRPSPLSSLPRARRVYALVAIGSSTGGPAALNTLLKAFPSDFALPVIIVQHMTAGFTAGLVNWLQGESRLPLKIVQTTERLQPGKVYFAPDDTHLELMARNLLGLNNGPQINHVRPSVDVLFESIARFHGAETIAVLLTGMGEDGAAGMKAIHDRGGLTIAQDEATSVVYGMPKAAAKLGAADHVLPLGQIAPVLVEIVQSQYVATN